jgi:hypothetical protein
MIPLLREHSVNSLDNFICGWYMDDTSICDKIIEYHQANPAKLPGKVGFDLTSNEGIIDKSIKDSLECVLNDNPKLIAEYGQTLQQCINAYVGKYQYSASGSFVNEELTNIQYYPPGGGYFNWHAERISSIAPRCNRHLVYMTYLNDVEDGGETEFFYQKIKIKPEKGLTLIWGSDWTFTHRGIVSPTQEKYIVTGWLHFSTRMNNLKKDNV